MARRSSCIGGKSTTCFQPLFAIVWQSHRGGEDLLQFVLIFDCSSSFNSTFCLNLFRFSELSPKHPSKLIAIVLFEPISDPQFLMCYYITKQGHEGSKTLHQQNTPVLNWMCQLTQVDLYNGHKLVVVVLQ